MANLLLGNPVQALNEGIQTGRAQQWNQLAGQAVSAPSDQRQGILAQAAQFDPARTVSLNGELSKQDEMTDERRNTQLVNMAKFLQGVPDQYKDQAYQRIRPSLVQFGIQAPPSYDDQVAQVAQSLVQAYTPTNASPAGFREFQATAAAAGLKPGTPEYQKAAKVALGTEGRASSGGYGFEMVEGRNGEKTLQRRNPRNGAVEQYNPQTGEFVPVGPLSMPGFPGINGSSNQPNQKVLAPNMSPDDPMTPYVIQANQAIRAGAQPDGVEAWLAQRKQEVEANRRVANPDLLVSRSPEATALAVQNAKNASDLAYLPQQEQIKTDNAIRQAGGSTTAKGQAERSLEQPQAQAALQDAGSNLDRMSQAATDLLNHPGLNGITSWQAKIPDIPGSDAANARAQLTTLKSQIGFAVLQAMRNASKTGGALGSVSDAEGVRLENNLAALEQSQSPEAFKANLRKIIDYAQGVKGRLGNAYAQTYPGGQGGAPSSNALQAGHVEGGYRFKGGDPGDQANWEKM